MITHGGKSGCDRDLVEVFVDEPRLTSPTRSAGRYPPLAVAINSDNLAVFIYNHIFFVLTTSSPPSKMATQRLSSIISQLTPGQKPIDKM